MGTKEAVPIFEKFIDKILEFFGEAHSLEEAAASIAGLYLRIDHGDLAQHLGRALLEADRIGARSAEGKAFAEASWGPGLPFKEAEDFFRAKGLSIAGISKADVIGAVKDEILKALESGTTLEEFRKTAREIFDRGGYTEMSPHRIDTIYRTNLQTAYQAGRYRQMTDPEVLAERPYWQYLAVMDAATRPEHAAMHGKVFPADHPFWDTWYPPNGFNCRCTVETLSESEMRREGLKVEREDPTGKLYEPVDPETGNKMPAVLLMPDPGWGERGNSLAALLEKQEESIAWTAKKNQPGWKEAGRPREREIPEEDYKTAPLKEPSRADYLERGLTAKQALDEIERVYRREMGISPKQKEAILKDPLGEGMKTDIQGLAHMLRNAEQRRERYLRYLRPTIEDPYEIWLTEYETPGGQTKFRKRYIGLFADPAERTSLVVIGEQGPGHSILWDAFQTKKGTVDRLRAGRLIYARQQ